MSWNYSKKLELFKHLFFIPGTHPSFLLFRLLYFTLVIMLLPFICQFFILPNFLPFSILNLVMKSFHLLRHGLNSQTFSFVLIFSMLSSRIVFFTFADVGVFSFSFALWFYFDFSLNFFLFTVL